MSSTILLADDSLTIQKVVELTFSDTDHEVVAVSSGEDLLQRLPDTRPDLVICDVLMPGTDGYEVCQRIKSDPKFLHIPVVLLTGTFEPFDRDRALAAGCSEIITKPFEARKLVETVERLLTGGSAAAAGPAAPPMQRGQLAPPPHVGDAGYETRLSPSDAATPAGPGPGEDEELEFTASGFAEMEAAAESKPHAHPEPPDDGLEFEIGEPDVALSPEMTELDSGDGDEPFADGGDAADVVPVGDAADEPFAEPVEATTAPLQAPEEPYADAFGQAGGAPFEDEEAAEGWNDGAFDDESFGEVPGSPPEAFGSGPADLGAPPAEDAQDAAPVGAPPPAHPGADAGPPAARLASPVFPAPPAPAPAAEPVEEAAVPPSEEPEHAPAGIDEADTAPVIDTSAVALSDEDVDRIARRVVELAAERIEQIAWEVVPDMAEIVVRERIRQLEAQADSGDAAGG